MLSAQLFRLEPIWSRVYRHRRIRGGWFRAIQLGPLAQVAPIDKLSVVIVAVFGVVLLGESLNPWQWLGVALMGGGAVLVAWP